jgi:AraC-like DNA-binding protein
LKTGKLKIKHLDKDSFVKLLCHILNITEKGEIFMSRKSSEFRESPDPIIPHTRLDIVLAGRKHLLFPGKEQIQEVFMTPGQIHYCPPLHWKHPVWDTSHEMSSIVYTPEFIRITYINYDKTDSMSNSQAASIFYHTAAPIGETGRGVLSALNALSTRDSDPKIRSLLIESLLRLTLDRLKKDKAQTTGKADATWNRINHYMRENFYYPINRAHVAKVFGLNPSYVSRLFTERGSDNFNSVLRSLRLEHAALLLQNTDMTIDEITDRCGYLSSTFLIAAFKKYFGSPPGRYRNSVKLK